MLQNTLNDRKVSRFPKNTVRVKISCFCLLKIRYTWFSPDVIAAMLVHNKREKVFWDFDYYYAEHEP